MPINAMFNPEHSCSCYDYMMSLCAYMDILMFVRISSHQIVAPLFLASWQTEKMCDDRNARIKNQQKWTFRYKTDTYMYTKKNGQRRDMHLLFCFLTLSKCKHLANLEPVKWSEMYIFTVALKPVHQLKGRQETKTTATTTKMKKKEWIDKIKRARLFTWCLFVSEWVWVWLCVWLKSPTIERHSRRSDRPKESSLAPSNSKGTRKIKRSQLEWACIYEYPYQNMYNA